MMIDSQHCYPLVLFECKHITILYYCLPNYKLAYEFIKMLRINQNLKKAKLE